MALQKKLTDFWYMNLNSLVSAGKQKNKNRWRFKMFSSEGKGYPNYDIIRGKFYRIVNDYFKNPTFDDSDESFWNLWDEKHLPFFKRRETESFFLQYSSDALDSRKKIKSVDDCLSRLMDCLKENFDIQKILRLEMKKFAVEMVERGMNPKEVITLSSVDTYWARYYNFFSFVDVHMYSPRAHHISLLVQQLELLHLKKAWYYNELLKALYFSSHDFLKRDTFFDMITEKRRLMSKDAYLYKRLKRELPELPLDIKFKKEDLEYVIKRIKRVTPTLQAVAKDKEMQKLFLEEIMMEMDTEKLMEKEMEEELMEKEQIEEEFKPEMEKNVMEDESKDSDENKDKNDKNS